MAPVALLRQWEREFLTRVKSEFALDVYIHHGMSSKKKIRSFSDLAEYDIVLTTYGLLAREHKEHFGATPQIVERDPRDRYISPFYSRRSVWYRVVLDEAQYIKNKSTLTSKACSALEAKYRWCLSGTPMQNSVLELYSLLRFLRIKPYDEEGRFNREIGNPIQKGLNRSPAMKKLQALLKAILLRRTKNSKIDGHPILQLPPKDIEIENIVMDGDETEFYKALEQGAQAQMNKYINQGTVMKNYSTILVLLLRLRQACCHPKLIERAHRLKSAKMIAARSGRAAISLCRKFNPQVVRKLENMTTFTCPVCMDAVDPANVILFFPCGDYICSECCGEYFESAPNPGEQDQTQKCATCSHGVSEKDLIHYSIFDLVFIEGYTDQEIMSNRLSDRRRQMQEERTRRTTELSSATRKLSIKEDSDSDSDFDLFANDSLKQPKEESTQGNSTDFKNEQHDFKFKFTKEEDIQSGLNFVKPEDTQNGASSRHSDDTRDYSKFVKGEPSLVSPSLVKGEALSGFNTLNPDPVVSGSNAVKGEPERQFMNTNGQSQVKGESVSTSAPNSLAAPENVKPEDLAPVVSGSNKYFQGENLHVARDLEPVASVDLSSLVGMPGEMINLFPNGWISSSKIEKCLQIIKDVHEKFPGEKVIVFSQFTSLLDFVEIALQSIGNTNYLRYDGSMSASSRNQCIIDFFDKQELDVLLISLKAGNVGLTLTCASHIVIMDPFWNPFVEEQAMDRAHRIGQMRPVFVHRLVIEGTVEDRILDLQRKKKELIGSALDENELKSIGKLNQKELLYLFGLGKKS